MSKALDNLEKLADVFEKKFNKTAQEQIDDYPFQTWLDQNFMPADKNKIANNIANAIENDLQSMNINLSVKNKQLIVEASVVSCTDSGCGPDATANLVAKNTVYNAVYPKISGVLSTFPNGSKYSGWIKYPK